MDPLALLTGEKFLLLILVLTRVSGLLATAPVFGTPEVPMQIRALLAFALAVLVFPGQWHVRVAAPTNLAEFAVLLGGELLVGMVVGLGVAVLLAGIDMAGQMIGQASGLSIAEIFDPAQGENVALFSRLLWLLTVAVFLCLGGHRVVMAGLLDTFHAVPPGGAAFAESVLEAFVLLAAQGFHLGLRAAAPVLAALLLANLVLGLIARTLPQLNVFAIGFGLNSLLTFAVMALTVGGAAMVFQDQVEPAVDLIVKALAGS